jgi:hypothetical protein
MKLYIYPAVIDEAEYHYVSILPKEFVEKHGLNERSILGKINDISQPLSAANITINPLFVTLLHKSIREALGSAQELHEEGKRRIKGLIYVVDGRAHGSEQLEPKYIAGAFPVKNCIVITDGYVPGPNYELIDEKGMFSLPDTVIEWLIGEITG